MKKYQSHKIVEAAKIYGTDPSSNTVVITEACHPSEEYEVPKDFFARGVPEVGDYLVRYQPDGYLSWSPKAVFEAGYLEVREAGTPAAVEVTVTAPAGKRAEVTTTHGDLAHDWTVTGGQSQTWSLLAGESIAVAPGADHSAVAHKRDAS